MKKGGELKMKKKYQKPAVSTIEIPERTAFACSLKKEKNGCPMGSSVVGVSVCKNKNSALNCK